MSEMEWSPIDGKGIIDIPDPLLPFIEKSLRMFRQHRDVTCVLSDREIQVIAALAEGGGYKGAAARLGLSHLTVKSHLARIRQALTRQIDPEVINISSPAALVYVALSNGWIA